MCERFASTIRRMSSIRWLRTSTRRAARPLRWIVSSIRMLSFSGGRRRRFSREPWTLPGQVLRGRAADDRQLCRACPAHARHEDRAAVQGHASGVEFAFSASRCPGADGSAYEVDWTLTALTSDGRRQVASGALKTKRLRDWQVIKLSVPTVTEKLPEDVELDFVVRSDQRAPVPIGLPLFRPVVETGFGSSFSRWCAANRRRHARSSDQLRSAPDAARGATGGEDFRPVWF